MVQAAEALQVTGFKMKSQYFGDGIKVHGREGTLHFQDLGKHTRGKKTTRHVSLHRLSRARMASSGGTSEERRPAVGDRSFHEAQ